MKLIALPIASVDPGWLAKAQTRLEQANAIVDEEARKEFIASSSSVWGELKPVLEAVSHGKCWYTEARDTVSYFEVDHYRPKKLYPWLAFDWKNLRLCGGKPNRKKLDKFPLALGSPRATAEAPDTGQETPLLLDPTVLTDPPLLTFVDNGEPICARPQEAVASVRVAATIPLYKLDDAKLCEARREKWRKCREKLVKFRDQIAAKSYQNNPEGVTLSVELGKDIVDLFDDKGEFTATAAACQRSVENGDLLVELARNLVAKERAA